MDALIERLRLWIREELWRVDLTELGPWRRAAVTTLRVIVQVARSFSHNVLGLTAAGLTLVTVLSLVPLLGLIFWVGDLLGMVEHLDRWFTHMQQSLPADTHGAIERLQGMVSAMDFRALGIVGSVLAICSGLMLFTRVEQALNAVWRTRRSRRWWRRLFEFVALVVLVPLFFVSALLAVSVLRSATWFDFLGGSDWYQALRDAGFGALAYGMSWCAFAGLYKWMPSVRVRWLPACAGGMVAGTALLGLHGLYLHFQVGVAQANALYATLAALPLLLIYVQLFWTVVLVGAEVSYAAQNLEVLQAAESSRQPDWGDELRFAWSLLRAASRGGEQGTQLADWTARHGVGDAGERIADALVAGGLLRRDERTDGQYFLARDAVSVDLGQVARCLMQQPKREGVHFDLDPDDERRLVESMGGMAAGLASVRLAEGTPDSDAGSL